MCIQHVFSKLWVYIHTHTEPTCILGYKCMCLQHGRAPGCVHGGPAEQNGMDCPGCIHSPLSVGEGYTLTIFPEARVLWGQSC